jgi:hypothetical protein
MSELEGMVILQVNAAEWIKLKLFEEHQIAVCMYCPTTEENRIVVQAVRGFQVEFPCPYIRIDSIDSTERKFRKKDRRIARWYFKELCRSLKEGILIQTDTKDRFKRRWK